MTQIIGDVLANSQAALINTTFSDGYLRLYAGDPATGVLIAPCKLPIAPFTVIGSGRIALAGQWFGTAIAAGTITWAQFMGYDLVSYMNVSVSVPGGGGQITLSQNAAVYGDVISITSFIYQAPLQ